MNKKKRILVLSLFILVSASILYLASEPNYQYLYGDSSALLSPELNQNILEKYCEKNDLNPEQLLVYEHTFNVYVNKTDQRATLPILNPNYVKSIMAVSSNIPLVVSKENQNVLYGIEIDPNWLEKQKTGFLKEKLRVKYLLYVEQDASFPLSTLLSASQDEGFKKSTRKGSDPAIIDLADQLLSQLPDSEKDQLFSVARTYALWIKHHIDYPAPTDYDALVGTFVNVKDPSLTLSSGLGVCEDNAYLLKAMLEAEGIQADLVSGYKPLSLMENNLLPNNAINHMLVLVHTKEGAYFVDPTVPDTSSTTLKTLANQKTISVYRSSGDTLPFFPMAIDNIEGTYLPPSAVSFTLEQIRIEAVLE